MKKKAKKKKPVDSSLEAFAITSWRSSEDFRASSDPTTLGAAAKQRQYLENRLLRAFQHGIAMGRELERVRIGNRINEALFGEEPANG